MQAMQQPREPNPFLDTLFKFSKVLAVVIAVLYAPDLHELTRDYITTKITANYGEEFSYYGLLAWWVALFGLTYYGLTFIFQSSVTFINTLWYASRF